MSSSTDPQPDDSRPSQSTDSLPAGAVPIYDTDDEAPGESTWYAASPGVGSYVAAPESWRPVPPPMLGSSLDSSARYRPHLHTKKTAAEKPRQPTSIPSASATPLAPAADTAAYGSVAMSGTADVTDDVVLLQPAPPTPVFAPRPPLDPSLRGRQPAVHAPRRKPPSSVREKITRMMINMRHIKEAPRELWLIFALKFLSSYAYFSLALILTLFLTDEFGMSDTEAGWAYGAYGVMSTVFGFACGWLIDSMGVRASLIIGAVVGAFARVVFGVTKSSRTAIIMLYTLLPFAESLGIPIMTIGIKRYTNARNRTFAFSLFYSMMNVAALLAGPLVDIARYTFSDGLSMELYPLGEIKLSALRVIILLSALSTASMCLVVFLGIREVQVDERGNVNEYEPNQESPWEHTKKVLREPEFWRLTLFTFLLVGVRLVFRHIDATLPKYLTRQFGEGAPFGLIYAINPFLIIFLVPIVGLLTRHVDSFSMILSGSFVSAVSPFWICFKQTYLSVVLFMVTLSIGEAVYSPRVYEYTMQVSPNGSEGLYSSLSAAPLFSVKLLVGGMSGWLLTNFMPANGPHRGNVIWGIIGITSLMSPVLMCLLREFIRPSNVPIGGDTATPGVNPAYSKLEQKESTQPSARRPPSGGHMAVGVFDDDDELDEQDGDSDRPRVGSFRGRSPINLALLANMPLEEPDEGNVSSQRGLSTSR